MAIETTLESIDASLKEMLVMMRTGASMTATMGAAVVVDTPAPAAKGKKAPAGAAGPAAMDAVLDGDAEGTKYWISTDGRDFYKTAPGEAKPPVEVNSVSALLYSTTKAAIDAKKSSAAEAKASTAKAEPIATAPAASADTTSFDSDVTFKQVVDALTVLSKGTKPGQGREGLMAILNKHLEALPANERKVPKLEALKINGQLLAEINAALSEEPAEFDPFA